MQRIAAVRRQPVTGILPPMKRITLALLVAAPCGLAHAGPVTDRWTAETSETRGGRALHTRVTFSYAGKVIENGRALWDVAVRCDARDLRTGQITTVSGAGEAMLAQGSFSGSAGHLGSVEVLEPENDVRDGRPGRGSLQVDDGRCARGVPVVRRNLVGTPAPATVSAARDPQASGGRQAAEATIREAIRRLVDPSLRAVDKVGDEKAYLTTSLHGLLMRKGREFNADPFTGNQEPEYLVLKTVRSTQRSTDRVDVVVSFTNSAVKNFNPVIRYEMVFTAGRWKVDDIFYLPSNRGLKAFLAQLQKFGA